MGQLDNISIDVFRRFLKYLGLIKESIEGGHEKWFKEGMTRPVIIQTHVSPIKRIHIKTNLDSIGVSEEVLKDFLKSKKQKKSQIR